ncbi:MAG TPA: DUF4097 family beta strand repeat-containing protein [Streptosporangiaceae bacterium]
MPERREEPMPQWTVDAPVRLAFDDVTSLKVRTIAGSVAILATTETPSLDITRLAGQPLRVTHEDGVLTISYEDLSWDGLLEWLRPRNHSAELTVTVPRDCPAQVGVIAASAVVSGITARTSLKSVSGAITLDGVSGDFDARTVAGDVEAQDVRGQVTFNSVSGDLTLAGGSLDRLDAKTVSGSVTADVDLGKSSRVRVATLSADVALRLPATSDARVDLRSTAGRVLTEFGSLQDGRSAGSHSVTGTLGTGSAKVSVTTLSGRVTLLRRGQQAPAQPYGRPAPAPPPPGQQAPPRGEQAPAPEPPSADRVAQADDSWAAATDPPPGDGTRTQNDAHTKGNTP